MGQDRECLIIVPCTKLYEASTFKFALTNCILKYTGEAEPALTQPIIHVSLLTDGVHRTFPFRFEVGIMQMHSKYHRPDVPPRRPRTCSTARYMSAAEDCGRPKSCKICGMALRVSNSR